MSEIELYVSIRNEIVTNHVLMHFLTFMVIVILLIGLWIAERRTTILSVFLPLLAISWAAAILRFDFFIHRQGAYLRRVEASLIESGFAIPLWEHWKASLYSTKAVVPLADVFIILSVIGPAIYLLFGPARVTFSERAWRFYGLYSWSTLIVLMLLLLSLLFIPLVANH